MQALIELAYIVIGIGDFSTAMMMTTPEYIFNSLIFMTAALTMRAGIEVMARMFTLLLLIMYIGIIIVFFMISPSYHPEFLLPLMPKGFKPILYGAYQTVSFPFAEFLLFSMVISYTSKKTRGKLGKLLFAALLINGLSVAVAVVCTIMVLGPTAGILQYSIFQLARLVDIADFLERIEAIIALSLIVGSFMKATIVLYVFTHALSKVLKLKDFRSLVFPVSLLSLLLSLTMFKNSVEFFQAVYVIRPLTFTVTVILPFLLLTIIIFFKRNQHSTKRECSNN